MSDTPTVLAERFRLVRRLARGGMGELWIAEHLGLGAEVVVKLIAPEHVGVPGVAARFAAEAASAARVNSPYVVKMIDYGVAEDGRPFLVMEKLEGRDLAAHLAACGPLEPALVARIVGQVASGLARAHALGIVHRDVKPSNVFLCAADAGLAVKLLDFGVAKTASPSGATTTAGWLGTPAYMSPEQIVGAGQVDARSDVWSLGVLAFECLTGRRPFGGETAGAIALAIHTQPTPKLSSFTPSLPAEIDAWFARACARDSSARFASVMDLADELARALAVSREATILEAERSSSACSVAPATITAEQPVSLAGYTRSAARSPSAPRRSFVVALALCTLVAAAASTRMLPATRASAATEGLPASTRSALEPRPSELLVAALSTETTLAEGSRRRPPPTRGPVARITAAKPALPVAVVADVATPREPDPGPSIFVMPDERH